jgi:hypothetical protein
VLIAPSEKCVYDCGSTAPFNREHIIAKQVAEAMGMEFPVPVRWGAYRLVDGESIEHGETEEDELGIVLENRVCLRCNANWMKKADDRMLGFMRPALAETGPVELIKSRQEILAVWATKVGQLLALWFHDNPQLPDGTGEAFVPPNNLARLYARIRPPERTRVWVGSVEDSAGLPSEVDAKPKTIRVQLTEGGPALPVGYVTQLRLRRLVFLVSGWDLDFPADVPDFPNPGSVLGNPAAMIPIWPIESETFPWPPERRLSPEDLDRLLQAKP